jgi:hypothetical protein
MNNSLCSSCVNCFCFTVINTPGGSGNTTKTICLINPSCWDDLVYGMYVNTKPYPYVKECSHYKRKDE